MNQIQIMQKTILNGPLLRAEGNQGAKKEEERKKKPCRYFAKNQCRHGFKGKTEYNGVKECPFLHLDTCRNLMNNGFMKGGCKKGKDCGKLHPKMCPFFKRKEMP